MPAPCLHISPFFSPDRFLWLFAHIGISQVVSAGLQWLLSWPFSWLIMFPAVDPESSFLALPSFLCFPPFHHKLGVPFVRKTVHPYWGPRLSCMSIASWKKFCWDVTQSTIEVISLSPMVLVLDRALKDALHSLGFCRRSGHIVLDDTGTMMFSFLLLVQGHLRN